MDEKSAQMAEQLRKNPAMLKSLMQSRDGQTLMRMLTPTPMLMQMPTLMPTPMRMPTLT